MPPPQLAEQELQRLQVDQPQSTTQASIPQSSNSRGEPSHDFPSPLGEGLVQVLLRYLNPPPHVALHGDHAVHLVQPPSRGQVLLVHLNSQSQHLHSLQSNLKTVQCGCSLCIMVIFGENTKFVTLGNTHGQSQNELGGFVDTGITVTACV